MKRSKELAYIMYFWTLKKAWKDLSNYLENERIKKYLMGKEQNDEMILIQKEHIDEIMEVERMFVNLSERYKQKPVMERLQIYLDFQSYALNLTLLDNWFERLNTDSSENTYEEYEEAVSGPRRQNEEIVKRFKKRMG